MRFDSGARLDFSVRIRVLCADVVRTFVVTVSLCTVLCVCVDLYCTVIKRWQHLLHGAHMSGSRCLCGKMTGPGDGWCPADGKKKKKHKNGAIVSEAISRISAGVSGQNAKSNSLLIGKCICHICLVGKTQVAS